MADNNPRFTKGERWEWVVEKVVDIPWGIIVFVLIAVLMATHAIKAEDINNAKALLPAAGLLGSATASTRDQSVYDAEHVAGQ
jgi:hypothetical protein